MNIEAKRLLIAKIINAAACQGMAVAKHNAIGIPLSLVEMMLPELRGKYSHDGPLCNDMEVLDYWWDLDNDPGSDANEQCQRHCLTQADAVMGMMFSDSEIAEMFVKEVG